MLAHDINILVVRVVVHDAGIRVPHNYLATELWAQNHFGYKQVHRLFPAVDLTGRLV